MSSVFRGVIHKTRRYATVAPKPTSIPSRPLWKKAFWPACLTAATGATAYYLLHDVDYVEDARGAHKRVPPLAFRPKTGGSRNLPIVTSQLDDDISDIPKTKPRLVIVGGGWGAVSLVNAIDKDKYDITVVSETNYFLFTPLLPSATVGTLEMRSLLEPMRKITKRRGAHFLEGVGVDLDLDNKLLEVQETGEDDRHFYLPYDQLIIAVGSTSITHGVEGIEHTERLKTILDAILIRRKVSTNVEKACLPTTSPEERKRLLSFVICGGGATGTEFAAEVFDWMNEDLVKWFPKLLREDISVTIIQSRSHILNTFDEQISEYAERRFEREGINIVTNARVVSIDKDKIRYRLKGLEGSEGGEPEIKEIPYGVCLWSTGIAMTPFAKNLVEKLGQQIHKRAILTDAFCRVKGIDDGSVFAIGDCATIENPKLLEHMMEIFEKADTNHDGVLNFDEFKEAVTDMRRRFPLSRQHLKELERLFHAYDFDKSGTIDMDEMRTLLKDVDNKMTALPATAQVASQQGGYLGRLLNQVAVDEDKIDENVGPFTYTHLGALAYLGNTAVGEFKWGYKMVGGLWSLYLWRSVYWSKQVSMRTRANLTLDWSKRALFGRDISTI